MDELFGFPAGRLSILLGQISEPSTNQLRLLIVETAKQYCSVPGLIEVISISWNTYVGYAVRNEVYALPEEGQLQIEHRLIERHASAYRSYLSAASWAEDPSKWRHFEVICEHHIIDVVSVEAPAVARERVPSESLMQQTILTLTSDGRFL